MSIAVIYFRIPKKIFKVFYIAYSFFIDIQNEKFDANFLGLFILFMYYLLNFKIFIGLSLCYLYNNKNINISFWNISRNDMQDNYNYKQFLDFEYNVLINMENIEISNHFVNLGGFNFNLPASILLIFSKLIFFFPLETGI